MQAFEPRELEKVSIAKVPVPKVEVREYREDRERGSAERFILVMSICLIWLIMLVWFIAVRDCDQRDSETACGGEAAKERV